MTGDNFVVYGYYIPEGGSMPADGVPNFMNNQMVAKSNDQWVYSPVKYWSNNENDKFKFFAYYPYEEDSNNKMVINYVEGGDPTFTYTPDNSSTKSVDLMTASSGELSKNDSSSGGVPLQFDHHVARILFKAKLDDASDDNTNANISSIALSNLVCYESGAWANGTFTWGAKSAYETEYETDDVVENTLAKTDYIEITTAQNGAIFVQPQPENKALSFNVISQIANTSYTKTAKSTYSFDVPTGGFVAGNSYTVQFSVKVTVSSTGDNEVEITNVTTIIAGEWDDDTVLGGNDTITGEPASN